MRVCVVVHQFPVRSETFIVDQVRALRAHGYEVVVVPLTPRPSDAWEYAPELKALVDATAPEPPTMPEHGTARWRVTVQLFARAARRGRAFFALARDQRIASPEGVGRRLLFADRVAASGCDLVHAHFATTASAAVALKRHGVVSAPVVCTVHGTDATTAAEGLFSGVGRDVTLFTAGSQFMRGVLERKGVPAGKIRLWPQGVDTTRPLPVRAGRVGFHVVSVGRLVEVKGVADSLRVIAMARPHVPGLRYTVIGDGPLRNDLEQLAVELGVADITEFRGALAHDEVLDAYDASDLYLQMGVVATTGAEEGQGLAPAEAAATGLPCIVTAAGGLPETVVNGQTGRVVAVGDVAAAADALRALASDAPRRAEFGRAARAHVEEAFSANGSVATLLAIYDEALGVT